MLTHRPTGLADAGWSGRDLASAAGISSSLERLISGRTLKGARSHAASLGPRRVAVVPARKRAQSSRGQATEE